MQRNSITLFLESPGATTPIPWVNDAPNFTGIEEPTLSVLTQAWQDFVDSGEPLEVIPDPEPAPIIPEPDWFSFNVSILQDQYWNTWKETIGDLKISIVSAATNKETEAFQSSYNIAKSMNPPSSEAIMTWQGLADQFHIAVTF